MSYTAQIERILNKHSSIIRSGSYVPASTPVPFEDALLNQSMETTLFNKKIGTLEFRFYPAGQAPTD